MIYVDAFLKKLAKAEPAETGELSSRSLSVWWPTPGAIWSSSFSGDAENVPGEHPQVPDLIPVFLTPLPAVYREAVSLFSRSDRHVDAFYPQRAVPLSRIHGHPARPCAGRRAAHVPEDFPHFSMEEIAALGALDYQARALAILQKFLPDFTADELKNAIAGSLRRGALTTRTSRRCVPSASGRTHWSFGTGRRSPSRDMALQLLPHLLTLQREEERARPAEYLRPRLATSGDTGKGRAGGLPRRAGDALLRVLPARGRKSGAAPANGHDRRREHPCDRRKRQL
ncbi:MAG: hypothetical protein ACLUHE_05390 [Christensenellales bacterium]